MKKPAEKRDGYYMAKHPIVVESWTESERSRFWSHVEKRGPDECWPWKGSTSKTAKGFIYGVVMHHGLMLKPHRVAWVLSGHELDPELTLDHSYAKGCRNKLCCNDAHLEQVTQSENTLRQYRDPERLYQLVHKCGHAREFRRSSCRRCAIAAVARSQAKRPDYYREMKTRNKRDQRSRERERGNQGNANFF